jgi:hypothetical protein
VWHNLGEAVERAVAQHCQCLRSTISSDGDGQPPDMSSAAPAALAEVTSIRGGRIADRTRERHEPSMNS